MGKGGGGAQNNESQMFEMAWAILLYTSLFILT